MNDNQQQVLRVLGREPVSGSELAARSGLSQSTVSRTLKTLSAHLLKLGQGRSTRYAVLREALRQLPIYRVLESGVIERFALISAVEPASFWVEQFDRENRLYERLPWWMQDMRPRGFLGRIHAKQNKLGYSIDANHWSEEQVLSWLASDANDLLGNLLVGDAAYSRFLSTKDEASIDWAALPELADNALRGEAAGSSAGGEQPKFITKMHNEERIVKFSPPLDQPAGQRWADGLIAEHIALNLLADSGFASSISHCRKVDSRQFLAINRFDRLANNGRRGIISMESVEMEFVGKGAEPWPVLAKELRSNKRITTEAAIDLTKIWCFGQLIANNDMHNGNASFVLTSSGPLALAPVYDMMPMAFMPKSSGHIPTEARLTPNWGLALGEHWRPMFALAQNYWQLVIDQPVISSQFKGFAVSCLNQLEALEPQLRRLA